MEMQRRECGDNYRNQRLDRCLLMESTPPSKLLSDDSSPFLNFSSSATSSGGGGGGGGGGSSVGDGGLGYIEHTVTKFDTLAGVAIKYGVEVADVKRMNGLTTDLQMFSRKTLHIPLPGRHPPSPIMSNGYDIHGPKRSNKTPPNRRYSDLFYSIKSLKLSSSSPRTVSPSMDALRDYYGLKPTNQNGINERFGPGTFTLEHGPNQPQISEPPSGLHRKSKSLVCELAEMSSNCSIILPHILTVIILVTLECFVHSEAQLQIGFYSRSCFAAEYVVKQEVRKAYLEDSGLAAGLVRMHFHDCFVRGCDGSVLIDSTPSNQAEKDSPANNPSLRGFNVIDSAKARLEASCPGIVSCADIIAFAARDSFEITGGLGYDVPAGRRDGRVSLIADTRALPPPTSNLTQLTQSFSTHGLTQEEMVTLSGSHTIGRSHCTSFASRLYSFSSTVNQDPSLDPLYASKLKQECPQGSNNVNLVVPMNPSSPTKSDTGYYVDVLNNRGLFTSDQSLLTSPSTANQVHQHAMNPLDWKRKFASAMVKMGRIGVITGQQGEIRLNCRVVNK